MSGICITGLIQSDADQVLALLKSSGVEHAKPSERDESMTLSRWHDQLLEISFDRYTDRFENLDSEGEFSVRQDIGRLWEQLASDIFIANLKTPAWAWSDSRSADVMPFWSQFDPQLKFILLVCSPERFVANCIEQSDETLSADALMRRWHAYHASLLHFSRSNSSKVLLLRAEDAMLLKTQLLQLCAAHFNLPISNKISDDLSPTADASLSAHIAARLCANQTSQESLLSEIDASLTPFLPSHNSNEGSVNSQPLTADVLSELVEKYRHIKSSAATHKQADLIDAQPNNTSVDQLAAFEEELSSTKQELSSTKQELQTKKVESEKILQQLEKVQLEIEKYFIKHQEAKIELESSQTRFQKLIARVPGYVELDSLEILSFQKGAAKEIEWRVTELESAGQTIPELQFTTFIESGMACLEFRKDEQGNCPLLRWPSAGEQMFDERTFTVAAVGDEVTGPSRARVLQTLSTSDWRLVQTLNALLIKEMKGPELLQVPNGLDVSLMSASLLSLRDHLAALPMVFHFDGVTLKHCQEDLDYEYLWLSFSNVLFGNRQVPRFDFRFSSVNVPSGNFGTNPRLEFHEDTSKDLFDGWFDESTDADGPKLELRFAQPSAMDMDVWTRLSRNDQALIRALIAELPFFIQLLKGQHPNLSRSWEDWSKLSESLHGSLLLNAPPLPDFEGDELQTLEPVKTKLSRSATRATGRPVPGKAKIIRRRSAV